MAYLNDTAENVSYLAELFGFEESVARAWLRCEGQQESNPTNILNILWYNRSPQLAPLHTSYGTFAVYANARIGLADAYDIVRRLAPEYGYDAVLAQRGSGDAWRQARAIERSGWAGDRYGSTDTEPGCIARQIEEEPVVLVITKVEARLAEVPANTQVYTLDKQPAFKAAGWTTQSGWLDGEYRSVSVSRGGVRQWWFVRSADVITHPLPEVQAEMERSQVAEAAADEARARAAEGIVWGRRLQSHMGAGLAIDPPEWADEVPA